MDLSIVVVSWNTRELLARCLESVSLTGDGLSSEVWVVDNASSDGSSAMVRERFPQVHVIDNPVNLGFARANNQAVRAATGQYVLLLNSDTEVTPGAMKTLVRFLDEHPDAGAVGPLLLNADGSLQVSCYPMPTLAREAWRMFHLDRLAHVAVYPMRRWDVRSPRRVEALMGACLLLRGEAIAQVGLLDEDFFMYTEEIDLCYRLDRAGWARYWVPGAVVTHHGGQSTRQASTEMFLQLYRSKLLFFRKAHGASAFELYRLVLFVAAASRVALSPLAVFLPRRARARAAAKAEQYRRLMGDLFAGQQPAQPQA